MNTSGSSSHTPETWVIKGCGYTTCTSLMTLMWFRCHIPHLTPTQFNGTWRLDDSQITAYTAKYDKSSNLYLCYHPMATQLTMWKFSRSNIYHYCMILLKWSRNLSAQWAWVQGSANGRANLYVLSQGSGSIMLFYSMETHLHQLAQTVTVNSPRPLFTNCLSLTYTKQ